MKQDFELLEHTADIKLRVYGNSLQELFCMALNGMFQAIEPVCPTCRLERERVVCDIFSAHHEIDVSAGDRELLLVDFLAAALSLSDIHNEAYFDATIHELTDTHIRATVRGVAIEGFNVEIKAVTYNDVRVEEKDGCLVADIVFDI